MNPTARSTGAILAVLLMVMLGGAWVPSFVFPAWRQRVTLAIPARWAARISRRFKRSGLVPLNSGLPARAAVPRSCSAAGPIVRPSNVALVPRRGRTPPPAQVVR
ncbi:MAG: hypothetical protein DMF78_19420 [Acidobacteria bacterium]|nr:MAG: hypothetical protein DMF78_19420 [Acidobacteriota bacterium]